MKGNRIVSVERETLNVVTFSEVKLKDLKELDPVISEISRIYEKTCQTRDALTINICGNYDPEIILYNDSSKENEIRVIVDELLEALDSDDVVKISLRIDKENKLNTISVYSLDRLEVYFRFISEKDEALKTLEQMMNFAIKHLYFDSVQRFELINDQAQFSSKAFVFTNNIEVMTQHDTKLTSGRTVLHDASEKHCNLIFDGAIGFIPDDFYLEIEENVSENMKEFFNSISLFLSLTFLVDMIKLKDNMLEYKIYGYRNMHKNIDFLEIKNLLNNNEEFFSIYQWVYEQNSNVSERIGMTRNVLSLFTNGDDIFSSGESALPSIKSSFEIYLKENVDKYIEVLNQVILLLNDLKKQSIEIANSYTKDFKNNFIALFTFLATTILFNTISSDGIENIFTEDITHITLAFLLISIAYWFISKRELNQKIIKLEKNYDRNKNYYKPILDPGDINRIFNETDYLDEDKQSINYTKKDITFLWLFTIGILFAMVFFFGESPIFDTMKEFFSSLLIQVRDYISGIDIRNANVNPLNLIESSR